MSYYGEAANLGSHEKTGTSSGSSKKISKNKGNSDKPKQPQRGLGVAQLEKIRLHSQIGCAANYHHNPFATNLSQEDMRFQTAYSSSPSFSYSSSSSSYACLPAFQTMMGNDLERANIRFGDSQPSSTPSWHHPGIVYEPQQYAQPNMTRHFLNLQVEDSIEKRRKKDRSDSECNGNQELDLELRL